MIPTETFGRTGHRSTRTIFGAAAFSAVTQEEADRTMELLLRYGVNHIDTAASYGDSELRLGPWMERHRGDFFLATKTGERDSQAAYDQIRRSLERLRVDQVDLIQLHNLVEEDEWQVAHGPGGAVAALAADPDRRRHNGRSLSSGEAAQEYGFTDLDGSRPDCWRYLVEVQDAGRPADTTGYR